VCVFWFLCFILCTWIFLLNMCNSLAHLRKKTCYRNSLFSATFLQFKLSFSKLNSFVCFVAFWCVIHMLNCICCFRSNKDLIRDLSRPPTGSTDLHFDNKYSQPFFKQCSICLWKQNLSYWRNIHYIGGRYFITTMIALLFGTTLWNLGMKR